MFNSVSQGDYNLKLNSNLPTVDLKSIIVPERLLTIIPNAVASKYSAIFFAEDLNTLKLAVGYPERLKQNISLALDNISHKLNKKIIIYKADPDDILKVLDKKPSTNPVQPVNKPTPLYQVPISTEPLKPHPPVILEKQTTPLPKLYIEGEIPYFVFSRIPYTFSQRHRIICIDFVEPNRYTVAMEKPKDPETLVILDYLEKNNKVNLTCHSASTRELDFLLSEYKKTEDRYLSKFRPKQKQTGLLSPIDINKFGSQRLKKTQKLIIKKPEPGSEGPIEFEEEKLAEGVIKPDIQGKIISGEKEKTGFSGTLEKFSTMFTAPKIVSTDSSINSSINTPQVKIPQAPKNTDIKTEEVAVVTPDKIKSIDEQDVKTGDNLGKLLSKDITSIEELKAIVKENNIPKIVAAMISYAIFMNASDIHIEPFEDELLVRYRIDGQLRQIIKIPPDMHAPLISRIKILSKLKLDETRIPQDGRFDVAFSSREVDLRVSTMPAVHGEKGVLRILDKSKGVISLESLGLEGLGFDYLIEAINKPYGIIMATGPTGSGKSTTLYAVLARVATSTVNVITLEDPVEYEMKGINQSQINPKIGYTFADGLRSILRQDPNIIMVGEVRDGETANMATQAALTGHLVLTTLHTNDASGALPRLINMGIEPFLITSSINAIIGQRLVRKICPKCREEITLPAGIIKDLEDELSKISESNTKDRARIKRPFRFYQGKGCSECNDTGYSGRVGVYEILPMSERIEELTIDKATANQILDQAVKEGMITMKQDGMLKVLSGVTTLDEVLKETSNK